MTVKTTININDELLKQANEMVKTEGFQSLSNLVESILQEKIQKLQTKHQQQEIEPEYEYYEKMKSEWLQNEKYAGKYVAIKNKQIIFVEDNEFDLVEKIRSFKNITPPLLIQKITLQEEVVDLFSPLF